MRSPRHLIDTKQDFWRQSHVFQKQTQMLVCSWIVFWLLALATRLLSKSRNNCINKWKVLLISNLVEMCSDWCSGRQNCTVKANKEIYETLCSQLVLHEDKLKQINLSVSTLSSNSCCHFKSKVQNKKTRHCPNIHTALSLCFMSSDTRLHVTILTIWT